MKQLLLSIALISAGLVAAEDPKSTKDTKLVCVVSGDEIDKANLKDQDYSNYKKVKFIFVVGAARWISMTLQINSQPKQIFNL